jgi:SAM-dependent methyltransferase
MRNPLELYEQALAGIDALGRAGVVHGAGANARRASGEPVVRFGNASPGEPMVRFADGSVAPLAVTRYLSFADPFDRELLDGIAGPVLDVGCGPGRHLHALTARGVYALGVDLSPLAVEYACRRGRAVVGDVFGEVPGAGEWATTLLLDGNIGIGGQPKRLLSRLRSLLRSDGTVLAEVEAPGTDTTTTLARIESDTDVSVWFPWARVSVSEIGAIAELAGLSVEAKWQCGERWFARLGSNSAG